MQQRAKIKKPVRTISGVTPLTVVAMPYDCPHGRCTYCPGGKESPMSYTTKSPAIINAIRLDYDPYKQVQNKLNSFTKMGHSTSKIEIIILGGTFLAYPIEYQYEFVKSIYDGLNGKKSKDLKQAKKLNETTNHRCVAFCIETKPDWAFEEHIDRMLEFGCTRVELGVQVPDDKIYKSTNRGHTVKDVIKSTKLLKDSGFKVGYHYMPGLPGSNPKKDLKLFKELFSNQEYKPDQLKIYPLQVMNDTPLSLQLKKGEFKLYDKEVMVELLCKIKSEVPEYCRIMRVLRQFHPDTITKGKINTNLRVDLKIEMKKRGLRCRCIRCREIGFAKKAVLKKPKLTIMEYGASDGREFFLNFESDDSLLGICRARIPDKPFRKEITKNTLIIRELHVYGKQVIIDDDSNHTQHKGLGKELMSKAEEIAKKNKCNKIVIISGVGVKEYYRKLGYIKEGPYMSKSI